MYELVLAYDALRLRNTIQVIGLCACNVGLLIYGAVQAQQIKAAASQLVETGNIDHGVWSGTEPFLIAIPIIVAIGSAVMTFIAWKLSDEFAWTIYKNISADLRLKRRYLTYQVRGKNFFSYTVDKQSLHFPDLHCPPEIRLLFLPWFYRSVRGYGSRKRGH